MRVGKRNDIFPASYTGDPLSAYRKNTRTAGWPSWNMLYLDSGPEPMNWVEPPKDGEEEEDIPKEEISEDDMDADPDEEAEVDEEAAQIRENLSKLS